MPATVLDTTMPPISIVDTAELLAGIDRGDPAAWAEIIRRYGRFVAARARSFRMQEADVHDAVQMTWMRLAEKHRTVTTPERLGGWLATTVSRECWLILHRARKLVHAGEMADNQIDLADGPEQLAVASDTAAIVREAVGELSPRSRELLEALFCDEPEAYAELSDRTGMPIGSIGPTRARGLSRLRALLDERGITDL